MTRKTATLIVAASALLLGAGCASEEVKARAAAIAKDQKEHPENWVLVYPTGSNVPVLVRKDQVGKTSDRDSQNAQDALRDAQRMGSHAPRDNGS